MGPAAIKRTRTSLAKKIGLDARYLKLKPDNKAPAGSFLPGKRNNYKNLPMENNFGIMPQGNLFIIDMDVSRGTPMEKQIEAFSKLLKIDLNSTFTVDTPSGGKHFYFRLPAGQPHPNNLPKTNLRGYREEILEITGIDLTPDADIRSEAARGYVVGPTSVISSKEYVISNNAQIKTIPENGALNLFRLRTEKSARRAKVREEQKKAALLGEIDIWANEFADFTDFNAGENLLTVIPQPGLLRKLERGLFKSGLVTYHQKRAFVKSALQCCYTPGAIAEVCIIFGIHRDTATSEILPKSLLLKDMKNFQPETIYHGGYCPVGVARAGGLKKWEPEELEIFLKKLKQRKDSYSQIPLPVLMANSDPQVVDIERISNHLKRSLNRGEKTKIYKSCLTIMEHVFQPMHSIGCKKVLFSLDAVSLETGLTVSQLKTAISLMRKLGIIQLVDRQRTGFAPTYRVLPKYFQHGLTYSLRRTWISKRTETGSTTPILYIPRSGGFYDALSREFLYSNGYVSSVSSRQTRTLEAVGIAPPKYDFVVKYLHRLEA